ncbi:Hypothetical predicted protein, partial [Podarcis lilfordi]
YLLLSPRPHNPQPPPPVCRTSSFCSSSPQSGFCFRNERREPPSQTACFSRTWSFCVGLLFCAVARGGGRFRKGEEGRQDPPPRGCCGKGKENRERGQRGSVTDKLRYNPSASDDSDCMNLPKGPIFLIDSACGWRLYTQGLPIQAKDCQY